MIFNLYAIIPGAIIILIIWGLNSLIPNFTDSSYCNLAIGFIVTTVGTLCEILGIPGRLFFMPVWFIGIIMVAIQFYVLFGMIGILVAATLVIGSAVFLYKKLKKTEEQDWESAKNGLEKFTDLDSLSEGQAFWKDIDEALFFPIFKDYDKEVCAHNISIIDVVMHIAEDKMEEREPELWLAFKEALSNNIENDSSDSPDSDLTKSVETLIAIKIGSE